MEKKSMKLKNVFLSLAGAIALSGCSVGSSGTSGGTSAAPSVAISGGILASSFIEASVGDARDGGQVLTLNENGTFAVSLSDLEVYVIYFSGLDVGVVKATVDPTSGAWTFNVPLGSQISAVVRDKTTQELVGPLTFVDTTNKDMSGRDKESTTFSFKSGASLGNIQLSDDGKFKVDATSPAIVAASNIVTIPPSGGLDFAGSWTLVPFTGTLPTGYGTACTPNTNCHGPEAGEAIYIVKLVGKKFSYSGGNCAARNNDGTTACSTTDGSVSSDSLHAAQIWGGGAAVQACGFKTGFAADDARSFGRLHMELADLPMISGTGVTTPTQMTFGRVTFTVPIGFGTNGGDPAPNNLPCMKNGATSHWDVMDCKAVEKVGTDSKTYTLNVCKGTLNIGGTGYQAMGGGGCLDGSNKPVVIKDWPALNALTPVSSSFGNHSALANIKVNTAVYAAVPTNVASATAFTCSNVWGTFTDSTATTAAASNAYIQTFEKVSAGSLCSGIADDLQRYKCYANAYFQDTNHNGSGCGTQYRFNWNATSINDFVFQDGSRDRPKQQYVTSIVNYSPDGQSITLEDEQSESVSVQVGTSSIACRVVNKTILKATASGAGKMLVDLTQSAFLRDTNVPACVGEKNNSTADSGNGSELYRRLNEGNMKSIFYLQK
jgi:hypothetical protein